MDVENEFSIEKKTFIVWFVYFCCCSIILVPIILIDPEMETKWAPPIAFVLTMIVLFFSISLTYEWYHKEIFGPNSNNSNPNNSSGEKIVKPTQDVNIVKEQASHPSHLPSKNKKLMDLLELSTKIRIGVVAKQMKFSRDQLITYLLEIKEFIPNVEIRGDYIIKKSEINFPKSKKKIQREIYPEDAATQEQICGHCGASNGVEQKFCHECGMTMPKIKLAKNTKKGQSRYIPNNVRKQVFDRDEGCCVKCGSKRSLQYDHILPFSKGGSNTVENIQLLCANCNIEKLDKLDG